MQPLRAHSWAEAHLYLKVTHCTQCSRGPWEVQTERRAAGPQTVRARCLHCGAEKEFTFECPPPAGAEDADVAAGHAGDLPAELINPSPEPSEIIDVGQWLSLFYHLVETANKAETKAGTRRLTFQAAQCLDEALKFYPADDALPPPAAFFTQASREAFAKVPEKFARERLRDIRSKLPEMRVMIGRIALDAGKAGKKRWWQFWKR